MVAVASSGSRTHFPLGRLDWFLDRHFMGHNGHPLSFDFAFIVAALPRARSVGGSYHAFVLQCGGFGAGGFRHGRPLLPDFGHYDYEFLGFKLQPPAARQDADALCAHRGWCSDADRSLAYGFGTAFLGGFLTRIYSTLANCQISRKEGIVFHYKTITKAK